MREWWKLKTSSGWVAKQLGKEDYKLGPISRKGGREECCSGPAELGPSPRVACLASPIQQILLEFLGIVTDKISSPKTYWWWLIRPGERCGKRYHYGKRGAKQEEASRSGCFPGKLSEDYCFMSWGMQRVLYRLVGRCRMHCREGDECVSSFASSNIGGGIWEPVAQPEMNQEK